MKKHLISADWKQKYPKGDCILKGSYVNSKNELLSISFRTVFISSSGKRWTVLPLSNTGGYVAMETIADYIAFISIIGVDVDEALYHVVRFIANHTYIIDEEVLDCNDQTEEYLTRVIHRIYGKDAISRWKRIYATALVSVEKDIDPYRCLEYNNTTKLDLL